MNSLIWFALLLLIGWLILRLALAVTSGLLHLLWIVAIVMFVMWLIARLRGKSGM